MSTATKSDYDYVLELASQLPTEERERLIQELKGFEEHTKAINVVTTGELQACSWAIVTFVAIMLIISGLAWMVESIFQFLN